MVGIYLRRTARLGLVAQGVKGPPRRILASQSYMVLGDWNKIRTMAVPAVSCLLNRQASNISTALPLPPAPRSALRAFRMAPVGVPPMNRSPFGTAGFLRPFLVIKGGQNSEDLSVSVTAPVDLGRRRPSQDSVYL